MRALKLVLKILAGLVLLIVLLVAGLLGWLRFGNPKVSPPDQTLKIEITPERVARGEYLANVMDCFGCHSPKLLDVYTFPSDPEKLGGGGFRIPKEWGMFPGDLNTPNITPYALARWTDGELVNALAAGVHRDGSVLFPMMPYQAFGKLDKEDIYSVIAFLRTLPSVETDPERTKIDFPVNLIVRTLPKDPQWTPRPDPSDEVATGRYLVEAGGCMMCHTKVDGQEKPIGPLWAGGRVFDFPPLRGVIRSANLTPDTLTGIGAWSRETFISIIRERGARANAMTKVDPEEPNTLMPYGALARMTDADLGAIYAYLRTLEPVSNSVVRWELRDK
jgi:mono/diheme cytochrome c family protein